MKRLFTTIVMVAIVALFTAPAMAFVDSNGNETDGSVTISLTVPQWLEVNWQGNKGDGDMSLTFGASDYYEDGAVVEVSAYTPLSSATQWWQQDPNSAWAGDHASGVNPDGTFFECDDQVDIQLKTNTPITMWIKNVASITAGSATIPTWFTIAAATSPLGAWLGGPVHINNGGFPGSADCGVYGKESVPNIVFQAGNPHWGSGNGQNAIPLTGTNAWWTTSLPATTDATFTFHARIERHGMLDAAGNYSTVLPVQFINRNTSVTMVAMPERDYPSGIATIFWGESGPVKKHLMLVFLLAIVVALPVPARVSSQSFGVSPIDLKLTGRPGERIEAHFTLATENTKRRTRFGMSIADIGQGGDSSVVPVPPGQGARSCAGWMTVPGEVQVPPRGRLQVPCILDIPPNARGNYFALISTELLTELPEARFATVIRPSIVIKVQLTVPGAAPLHVDVTQFFLEPSPPAVVFKAENTGVWKSSVEGDVLFYSRKPGTWPVRTSIPYAREGRPTEIYPGLAVDFRCPLSHPIAPGSYKALVRLLLNGEHNAHSWFEVEVPAKEGEEGAVIGDLVEKSELDVLLRVEPNLVEVNAPPGARRTIAIKIQNEGDREAMIQVEAANVRVEQSGMLTFPESAAKSTGGWITVSPQHLTLLPGRRGVVKAQMAVPRDKPENAPIVKAVRIRATAAATEFHDDWSSGGEYAVLIVPQDPKAAPASLETISLDVVRLSPELNPTAAVLRVKNSGGRVARAYGRILLERTNGQELARMDIGATQPELILPGMEREFRMPLPPLDKGKFRVRAEIKPGGKGGKTAQAEEVFATETAMPEGLKGP